MLIHLESFTKDHSSALNRSSYHWAPSLSIMAVILASLTPITEEHTKLIDHLSEPSSWLIRCVSHPLEEDILAEVLNSCFICVWVHSFASCVPTFFKGSLCHYYCWETALEVNSFQTPASSQLLSPADYALVYYNAWVMSWIHVTHKSRDIKAPECRNLWQMIYAAKYSHNIWIKVMEELRTL